MPVKHEKPIRAIPTFTHDSSEQIGPNQLKWVLKQAGFQGESLETAWAIVMRESSGRPRAHNHNPSTLDNSYGLFQINMTGNLGPSRRAKYELTRNEDLFNAHTNAKIAYAMSGHGKDFGAWAIGPNSYREDRSMELNKWRKQFPDG